MPKDTPDAAKPIAPHDPRIEDYQAGEDDELNVTGLKVRSIIRNMQSMGISDDEINLVLPTLLNADRK